MVKGFKIKPSLHCKIYKKKYYSIQRIPIALNISVLHQHICNGSPYWISQPKIHLIKRSAQIVCRLPYTQQPIIQPTNPKFFDPFLQLNHQIIQAQIHKRFFYLQS
ncbi:hypothetical protein HanIR_Chr16g0795711 [Helianthus annuus]|nr:hypothetical protein HanIR_Chr16g0795711 [Helianthus annuus]